MRGTFVNGKIEVEEPLPDGTIVNFVVVEDDDDEFALTPEQEEEIEQSIAEIERGEYVDGDEVIRKLRSGEYAAAARRQRAR